MLSISIYRLLFLLLILSSFSALAQPYDPARINKKAMTLYTQAQQRAEDGNLVIAAGLLGEAIAADKNFAEAYLALAVIYGKLKNYPESISTFEKAFAIDTAYTIDFKPAYAAKLAGNGEFEKALAAINDYLSKRTPKNPTTIEKINKQKKSYEFAVAYAATNKEKSYVFAPKNLGTAVNSAALEYWPYISIDGSELVFTRRVNGQNEDFYISKKVNGEWTPASAAGGTINSPQSEAAQTLSADGQWMIYSANGRKDSYGNYDLYMAQLTPNGWEDTYHFGGRINTDQWESQPSLSPDGKDLYFSSRRPGGYGGIDIYVCRLQPNGYFSAPENLGPAVNTAGDDQCPFIHADNQTLYFTSNHWPGYGDDDLFFVRKQPDGSWSQPINLGYPINTVDKEGTLFIAADGKTAYYASDRTDTQGGLDLYSFELREDIRPARTLWVKGKVFDQKTLQGISSSVELTDLSTKQLFSQVQTDTAGHFFITLPVGRDYSFSVNKKGYLFYSDQYLLASKSPDSIYRKDIALSPIEINANVVLRNIFFDVNKAELQPASQSELDKLAQLLLDNPGLRIEIGGHTDNIGTVADNLTLSNNRAKAVVNYLVAKKIPVTRLVAKGYGAGKPVADNKTEEGRALNRRTELKVIGK
jgi:outer membrane protein OmpA-like peptidoglycan-associated protein